MPLAGRASQRAASPETRAPESRSGDTVTLSVGKLARAGWLKKMAGVLTLTLALGACTPPGTTEAVQQPLPQKPVAQQMVEKPAQPTVEIKAPAPEPVHIEPMKVVKDLPLRGEGEHAYHFTSRDVDVLTKTTLTQAELGTSSQRYTPVGVDSGQTSKRYPEGQVLHQMTELFQECTRMDYQGNCQETRANIIQYKHISCLYRDETTGQTVRILQRSPSHVGTSAMNRFVCGGHKLKAGKWGPEPVQTDYHGNPLYLNPFQIVDVQPVQK